MSQEEYSFPQDWGTGAYPDYEGDPNDAANFGSLVGAVRPISVIVRGLTFSNVDYTNLTFDVDAGKFYVVGDGITAGTSNTKRDEVGFVNGYSGNTGFGLTGGDINHVFISFDPATNDSPSVTVNTTGTKPDDPNVKIGEINTTEDSNTEQWNLVTVDGTITYPNNFAIADSSSHLPNGTSVFNRANERKYKIVNNTAIKMTTASEAQMNSRRNN